MLKKLLVVLLFSVSFSVQAKLESPSIPIVTPYIVGGYDAPQVYPWMAQVFLGNVRCGGVLIAESWVVTAAHCTYRSYAPNAQVAPEQVTVVLGGLLRTTPLDAQSVTVSEIYQHPQYISPTMDGPNFDYDISLLRLSEFQQGEFPIINLNMLSESSMLGSFMTVIGFGRINSDPFHPVYPDVLQQGNLRLISPQQCANYWGSSKLTDRMFCAYGTDQDACAGDSGGPVFVNQGEDYRLLGIVSWGSLACQGLPGVYTDIGRVCGWISDILSQQDNITIACAEIAPNASSDSSGGGAAAWLLVLSLPLWLFRRGRLGANSRR
ncbi:serine protease [Agarivorans sp. QJM3NY_29]|uniref:serine protease n=1 Tax=unclassified Agarivorans TaxID=2636026 RepID=UPI003D7CD49C